MDAEAGREFEERVRAAMAAAGFSSLAELARASGIKTQVWYSWFRGEKRPRANSLRLAAQALHTTPGALADLDDAPVAKERGEADTDLASAIRDQTRVMGELVAALRPMAGPLAQQVADLQWAVQRLFEQAELGSPKPPVRRPTVE